MMSVQCRRPGGVGDISERHERALRAGGVRLISSRASERARHPQSRSYLFLPVLLKHLPPRSFINSLLLEAVHQALHVLHLRNHELVRLVLVEAHACLAQTGLGVAHRYRPHRPARHDARAQGSLPLSESSLELLGTLALLQAAALLLQAGSLLLQHGRQRGLVTFAGALRVVEGV